MASKCCAPPGGRKNLACQNLISASRHKSSVIFQSGSGDHVHGSVIHLHHRRVPRPIEGERQTAGRHFVRIRRVGDGECRIPRIQNSHDRKEDFALGRTNIEDSHVIRERILEVIVPTLHICEEGFRHDAGPVQREGYLCVLFARIGCQRQL